MIEPVEAMVAEGTAIGTEAKEQMLEPVAPDADGRI